MHRDRERRRRGDHVPPQEHRGHASPGHRRRPAGPSSAWASSPGWGGASRARRRGDPEHRPEHDRPAGGAHRDGPHPGRGDRTSGAPGPGGAYGAGPCPGRERTGCCPDANLPGVALEWHPADRRSSPDAAGGRGSGDRLDGSEPRRCGEWRAVGPALRAGRGCREQVPDAGPACRPEQPGRRRTRASPGRSEPAAGPRRAGPEPGG